jgi:hypothetical protein
MKQKTEKRKFYKVIAPVKYDPKVHVGVEPWQADIYTDREKIFLSADNFLNIYEEAWLACTNQQEVIVVDGHVYMSLDLLLESLPFIKPLLESIEQVLRKCVEEKKMTYAFETECSKQDS